MERFQVRIWLGRLLDGLGKVGGGKDPLVGLAQAGPGTDYAGFAEVMKGGSPRRFPADFALVEEIQVAAHRATGSGRALGQRPDDPMVPGQPDGQQTGLPLAAEMEQNSFILKRLAQASTLAERANREDKRDDSG